MSAWWYRLATLATQETDRGGSQAQRLFARQNEFKASLRNVMKLSSHDFFF